MPPRRSSRFICRTAQLLLRVVLAIVTSDAKPNCYKPRVMTSATFAACVEGGGFGVEEAGTGPASTPRDLGRAPAPGRARVHAVPERPRIYDSAPPPAPGMKAPRKVAGASPVMARMFELLEPLARSEI